MAGIQASGVGSGLDINSLVAQLVSAEAAPHQQRITRHEMAVTTKLSALGTLKGALGAFKSALEPLKTTEVFQTRKATSGNKDVFTVTADTDAVAGHYDVEVVNLAKAHQLASGAFAGGSSSVVGYGSLTISVGGESFTVEIDEEEPTLAAIRNAINEAADNTGVQATLLNTSEGTRLVLTASETGAEHAIVVTASGGDGGLDQLTFDPEGVMNLTEIEPAQNALIRIAGFDVESDTNVFDDAIDGLTITAIAPSDGETVDLDVSFDLDAVQSRIQKFVSEYNNMQAQLARLGSYNAETKVAGPMLGDALLRGVESEVRRVISSPVEGITGELNTLASIGITTSATGALEIDNAKLTEALNEHPEAVAELFGSENGIAARLYSQLEARLASEGDVETRNASLQKELKDIEKDKEALSLRLAQLEQRYRAQFTALDSLLAQMQSTSSYLAQQLANLPKIG
ncbi:MAG TPA: flagellar filament capping protein FliD [Steroidobacteraceae bacterium]